jgi:protein-disulfide isomerase
VISRFPSSRHRFAAVLGVALALGGILVVTSQISAKGTGKADAPTVSRGAETSPFAGIPQRGRTLGSPRAPVTLVEYADLQCPYCGVWARETLPVLVDRYVRTGTLRLVFNGLAFVGPDSDTALRSAVVAGRHNRLWDVVHAFYERQGTENTGWVTDDLVREIGDRAPGLEADELLAKRWDDSVDRELRRAAAAAHTAGVNSTPSFQIGPTGGRLRLVQISSLDPEGIQPAIEAELAG